MKSLSRYVDRSIQPSTVRPSPATPVIEGQWRERKAPRYKISSFAWFAIGVWVVFTLSTSLVILGGASEFAIWVAAGWAVGSMFTAVWSALVGYLIALGGKGR